MVFSVFAQAKPAKLELAVDACHMVAAFVFLYYHITIRALLVFVAADFPVDFNQNVFIVLSKLLSVYNFSASFYKHFINFQANLDFNYYKIIITLKETIIFRIHDV